jgi:hypothetical protein
VLITLDNVKLKTVADSMYHVGTMTQGATDFKFDDGSYRLVESGTGALPAGTCFDTITGIASYNVYDNNWVFYPVEQTIDTTGGTCP